MDSLVSTEWLADHLREPGISIVDASWHMPASGRSGHDEFLEAHIPGACFLDIDAVSDRTNAAPHMLPRADEFAAAMEALGVGSADSHVVSTNKGAGSSSSSSSPSLRTCRSRVPPPAIATLRPPAAARACATALATPSVT
mgnify:CR=1 FL=1